MSEWWAMFCCCGTDDEEIVLAEVPSSHVLDPTDTQGVLEKVKSEVSNSRNPYIQWSHVGVVFGL